MRFVFPIILSATLFISPLAVTATELTSFKTEQRCEKGSQISDYFFITQRVVSKYSNGNSDVWNISNAFLTHLYNSYCVGEGMIEKDVLCILTAVKFAAEKHQFQVRKNPQKTPYIIHPIGVADHLLMVGNVRDPAILIGALLHDTVEDTDTTFEEIDTIFGTRVGNFVREVTDDKSLQKMERKKLQIEHAPGKSAGAAQIKLADKFYNLNDLQKNPPLDWEKERIEEYFGWARSVVNALPWVNAALKSAVDQVLDSAA